MSKRQITVDRKADNHYVRLRRRYGEQSGRANGYLYEGYFRAEQRILFSLLDVNARVLVDVACGTGLMVRPLIDRKELVIGVDFNADACRVARAAGLTVVRGNAFELPLHDASVDEIVTCQFFNQQQPQAVELFVAESARILRPGGQLIMVWRNGAAWIHRVATAGLGWIDRLRGQEGFPYEEHEFERIREYAQSANFDVKREAVSFPPFGWCSDNILCWRAKWVGASNISILVKRNIEQSC
jgi:SAM-dependent methyltransferase